MTYQGTGCGDHLCEKKHAASVLMTGSSLLMNSSPSRCWIVTRSIDSQSLDGHWEKDRPSSSMTNMERVCCTWLHVREIYRAWKSSWKWVHRSTHVVRETAAVVH